MSPLGQFLSDTTVQVNPDEMGCGRRGCFTRAEPRASLEAAAVHRLSLGWQLPWARSHCLAFVFQNKEKTHFSPPLSGKQETDSYKDSPTYRLGRKKAEFGNIKICSSNADQ